MGLILLNRYIHGLNFVNNNNLFLATNSIALLEQSFLPFVFQSLTSR